MGGTLIRYIKFQRYLYLQNSPQTIKRPYDSWTVVESVCVWEWGWGWASHWRHHLDWRERLYAGISKLFLYYRTPGNELLHPHFSHQVCTNSENTTMCSQKFCLIVLKLFITLNIILAIFLSDKIMLILVLMELGMMFLFPFINHV